MTHPYKNEVARALFFASLVKEKLQPIKEASARDAKRKEGDEETPQGIATALERAIYADAILRAFVGIELIEEGLKTAAKLHGSLTVQQVGFLIGVQIKPDSDLTNAELDRILPKEAKAGTLDLLAAMLGGERPQCDCPKCRAKRSGH